MNTCFNAVDRHVRDGRGSQAAIIYDSPVTDTKYTITYDELLAQASTLAGALVDAGVEKGDRVLIYMPMVPEAIVSMLACARIGAVHSVVFGGFAPKELAIRIDDARPKVVLSASCGLEGARVIPYKPLLDGAIGLATHKPDKCIIVQRDAVTADLTEGRDQSWTEAMANASPVPCVELDATDPLYILYTSGTTGVPKGVLRDNGGHAVMLQFAMNHAMQVQPGEVYWSASDVGWVVGHTFIVYAPLIQGATTVLYEGKPVGTPDAGAFWRVIAEHNVNAFFTAPTALRAIRRDDPSGTWLSKYKPRMSSLRNVYVAGERCDPETMNHFTKAVGVPFVDNWWQTETGCSVAGFAKDGVYIPGSSSRPVPGWDVQILDGDGKQVPSNVEGEIVMKLPLPPGAMTSLYNNDDRFVKSYLSRFEGYYLAGDAGYIDDNGYVYIMGRTDDVINTAGHRLSTGAMEEILIKHPDVAECAVVGVADKLKGQIPLGLFTIKTGSKKSPEEIGKDVVQMVRSEIGAVASFKNAILVNQLPKTRSGKILRGVIQAIADGKEPKVPGTIEDYKTIEEVTKSLRDSGFPRSN
jgi:propionyl-CoA synthetase